MIKFPELLLELIIAGSLLFSGIVAVILIYLIIKDKKNNEVW